MKRVINKMKLAFMSASQNEGLARLAVSGMAAAAGADISAVAELKTAVSEGVTNAIVHGYRKSEGMVYLDCTLYDNGLFRIVIKDKGIGIEDIEKAMEPLYTTAPEEERAGLGFAIMESFCDRIKVRSRLNAGTSVTLEKYIHSKDKDSHEK